MNDYFKIINSLFSKTHTDNSEQNLYETSADYIKSMRIISNNSNRTLPDSEAVILIQSNMTSQIAKCIIAMETKTFNELKANAIRIENEFRIELNNINLSKITESGDTLSQLSNEETKVKSRRKRIRPRCHYCGIIGHIKTNCRRFAYHKNKYSENSDSLNIEQPD